MTKITVGTANIAGAARQEQANPQKYALFGNLLHGSKVDVLALQEVVRVEDLSGQEVHDDISLLKRQSGLHDYKHFFFPHLDSTLHPHPGKWESAIFARWYKNGYRIRQGSAILVSGRHSFWHLLSNNAHGSGSGQVIPWNIDTPTFYRGNRDTEPRSLLMARIRMGSRFILFCCTQLTTLTEEDSPSGRSPTLTATGIRTQQTKWIVSYLKDYTKARQDSCKQKKEVYQDDLIVLAGDFNAEPMADELKGLGRGLDLQEIAPASGPTIAGGKIYTHRKHKTRIDLIFAKRDCKKSAEVLDLEQYEIPGQGRISDHHPVVAEIVVM